VLQLMDAWGYGTGGSSSSSSSPATMDLSLESSTTSLNSSISRFVEYIMQCL